MAKSADKMYEEFNVEFQIADNSRETLRKQVVDTFLHEKAGYWKNGVKHVTRYKYFVEKVTDGRRIYLYRPTHLNKGIDFQVWVEKFNGEKDGRPSHKDILMDMQKKLISQPKDYFELLAAIERVWNCEEPTKVLSEQSKLKFSTGYSMELILKILKWLFIEQDLTYWNYDGRSMLWQSIKNIKQ